MDHLDFVNTSLRLRYEAFSTFATQVNEVDSLPEIGDAIAANLKFILDTFALRLVITIDPETYAFELFRGKCTVSQPTGFNQFERNCLKKELPLTLNHHDIHQEALLGDSLFGHPKITHLMVLPINHQGRQKLVLSIANKNGYAYNEMDFRFARLIEELLSTKVSQILLTQKVAFKNADLERANGQLSQLNQKVHLLNTKLEIKVKERTHRLKEAHQELSTLLYRTSHDFRRPLTAILGLAGLFPISKSTEETAELVGHLEKTVAGLDGMLIKLQALTLVEAEGEPVAVDFSALVDKIKDNFEEQLTARGTQCSIQVTQTSTYLSHPAIHQAILENLVENAIRYGNPTDPHLQLLVKEANDCLIVQVSDNGIGIPKRLLPTVFDMYVKANDRAQGNGLGLFVVKKLVQTMGGNVEASSVEREGSCFVVTLPLGAGQLLQSSAADDAALLR